MTDDRDTPPRSDPVTEFQRWLMRSSARNLGREVKGQVRRAFGGGSPRADVWETATSEPPPAVGEAPECAWCPVCRTARRMRDSGPGLASQVAGAGDALMAMAQDTLTAFEASLSGRPPPAPGHGDGPPSATGGQSRPPSGPGREGRPGEGTGWPGEGTGWPGEASPRSPERAAPDGPDRRP